MHQCMETDEMGEADWRLIRAFVAVMETGSLSAAAVRTGATQPTVGRQIRELERRSGAALFLRRGQRLTPTERAMALFPRALDVSRAVSGLVREFGRTEDAGEARPVRLTLPTLLADEMLPDLMPALQAAAPQATFEILPSDAVHDLMRRDADIAVRMTEPRQPELLARRVGEATLGLYAARAYLAEHGTPQTRRDLVGHRWIVPLNQAEVEAGAGAARLDATLPDLRAMRSDDLRHRLALLRAGIGLSPTHTWIGARDPNLVRLLPQAEFGRMGVWIVANDDLRRSPTLRAVFDALAQALPRRLRTAA